MKLIQFFQENNGKLSMNRLLAFIIVGIGLIYGLKDFTYSIGLVTIGCGLIGWKNYETRKKDNANYINSISK